MNKIKLIIIFAQNQFYQRVQFIKVLAIREMGHFAGILTNVIQELTTTNVVTKDEVNVLMKLVS